MKLKTNKKCQCEGNMIRAKANVSAENIRNESMDGREYLVVPVTMIVDGVVMNDAYVPRDEFTPEGWNGRPVTVGHPQVDGLDVTANDPKILQEYSVGQIFNARDEDGKLKAEAWIDVQRCRTIKKAAIISMLKDKDAKLQVSTGYFCITEDAPGKVKGNSYSEIHRDLKPDHLALLPDEEGACSWDDGCGVRPNKLKTQVKELIRLLTRALKSNHLEVNMDPEEKEKMIDTFIGNEDNPFEEKDKETLMGMEDDMLKKVMKAYMEDPDNNEEEEEKPEDNEEGDDEKPTGNKKDKPVTMSKEDQDALAYAKNLYKDHRGKLVKDITANSAMMEEQLKDMDTATLETIANGLLPEPNYGGRAGGMRGSKSNKDDLAKAMTPQGTSQIIALRNKKAKEA